mgnify:CR=1 FL=1
MEVPMEGLEGHSDPGSRRHQYSPQIDDAIFTQPKDKNRQQVKAAAEQQKIAVYLNADVKEIGKTAVTLAYEGKEIELQNNAVIVCAGGTLPTPMLKEIGVMVDTYYGQAVPK